MSCCDPHQAVWNGKDLHRRTVLKGAAALAGTLAAPRARAAGKPIKLAFCSQLLCIIPYEVARAHSFYEKEGLDVELVYARGGGAAMQALVGGAVDYGATALDVALIAYSKHAPIRRFLSTGKLPLFALVVAPQRAKTITSVKSLEGHTVGVSGLGNADHALCLYLLHEAGADASRVQFATMGPNLLEALRQGQVDAGMVQEPALTLIVKGGGRVLVNAMNVADARKYLGGNYEFMGVAVRTAEIAQRTDEMKALARALSGALQAVQTLSPDDLVKSLPPEMTTGADTGAMRDILAKYRASLYPTTVRIDLAAADRVARALEIAGLLPHGAKTSGLYDTAIAG
ncbi:MAG: ABC transporter substrate-binding protein [Alphaproteobacteria bacterium]|nr:ABC transporter substrate-binding protein [Alphaproteobacteria bacterium]